jgi:WD40 repeat protein
VVVTSDGGRAVSASDDRTLKVWDLGTGAALLTLVGHAGPVRAVAVAPDGRRALSASSDRTLKVWDLDTGAVQCTLAGHAGPVRAVAVTPDGRRAVSASDDATLKVWDLDSGRIVASFPAEAPFLSIAVGPDGLTIVAGDALGRLHFLRIEGI